MITGILCLGTQLIPRLVRCVVTPDFLKREKIVLGCTVTFDILTDVMRKSRTVLMYPLANESSHLHSHSTAPTNEVQDPGKGQGWNRPLPLNRHHSYQLGPSNFVRRSRDNRPSLG